MKKNAKTLALAQTALLSAIIVLMAFTPIGFLKIGLVEITFMSIPVTIGAIILGPAFGAYFGALFGTLSFIQCFGLSAFGATLLAINPFFTFALCLIPRILMGFLTGLAFKALKNTNTHVKTFIPSLLGPLLNTVFFVLGLILMFGKSDYIVEMMTALDATNVFKFAIAFVGTNGLIEAIACTAVNFAVIKSLQKLFKTVH
ncbi:MAG: ECF transporter S component [Clostridia bacterium]